MFCRPLVATLLVSAATVTAADPPAGTARYAVLVGVNEYDHPKLPALKYAENDVTDLGGVLKNSGYAVTLMTGTAKVARLKPTRANVEARLKEVLGTAKKGDMVVVAFAGHGLQFEGKPEAYFCPSDARPLPDRTDALKPCQQDLPRIARWPRPTRRWPSRRRACCH